MRRWKIYGSTAATAILVVAGLACESAPEKTGGFSGDSRPTFAAGDPYEDAIALDWHRWSDDLFGRSSSKPILLHLGGKWCHLCHVYDTGVYGNADFASFIGDNFTLVRVDPDERPDVDNRYNQGNWPTVCVLTPDGDVVGGLPYNPDEFEHFLRTALAAYVTGGDSLRSSLAQQREMQARSQPFQRENGILDPTARDRVLEGIKPHIDEEYGGFRPRGDATSKIVSAGFLNTLLLELISNPGLDDELLAFVQLTLDGMMDGAVHDHLFGGFFRSVDDRAWTLPRFGKTLIVQAEVAELYMLAAAAFDRDDYRAVALETIDFVFDTLANPDSLTFGNAVDPDLGPGDAGSYYTWTVEQIDSLLPAAEAEAIKLVYGIAPSGEIPNRESENTLFIDYEIDAAAARSNMDVAAFTGLLDAGLARMRASRLAGPRPRIDERAFAEPNLAFARVLLAASTVFDDPSYRDRGIRLLDFFTATHSSESGGVPHGYDGKSVLDLALLANQVAGLEALTQAFETTSDESYLTRLRRLEVHVNGAYRNEATGAYWDVPTYATGPGFLQLKLRPIRYNVRMASVLMDIAILTANGSYAERARDVLLAFSQSFGASGLASIGYSIETHRLLSNQTTEPASGS